VKRCPHCKANGVYRDDCRLVCLFCGWVKDDTIADELAALARGSLPLEVGPLVALHRANEGSTWHSGLADPNDDGYAYGASGERHSRDLIGDGS
jgi:hypothetical protein